MRNITSVATKTARGFVCLGLAFTLLKIAPLSPVLAEGDATLSLSPTTSQVQKGSNLVVMVLVDTGGVASSGASAFVSYPTDKLAITEAGISEEGAAYTFPIKELKTGIVGVSSVPTGGATVTGTGKLLVTLTFSTLATGDVTLAFSTGTKVLDAQSSPQDITNYTAIETVEGTYTIVAATTSTHLECQSNVCVSVAGAGSNTGGCSAAGAACNLSSSEEDDGNEETDDQPDTGFLENTIILLLGSMTLVSLGIITPSLNLTNKLRTKIIERFEKKVLDDHEA